MIKKNIHFIENVKLYSRENKLVFEKVLNQLKNLPKFDISNLEIDKNLVKRVMSYASVKHIIQKYIHKDEKILEFFSEIIQDLKNYEFEQRILDLESKFSQDLSEDTFNELKELKKQQKIN